MAQKCKAIIFDMDGLVLDTEATYVLAWRQTAEAMGYELPNSFWRSLSGLHGDAVIQQLQNLCDEDFALEFFQRLSSENWQNHVQQHGIPVKPGLASLLQLIKRLELPFCLATNSPRPATLYCLALANLEQVFPLILTREEVTHGKPAPDIFLAAAKAMGYEPGECLVLEDSAVGIAAAKAAGCPCLYIPSVYPPDAWAAEKALAVLEDLHQAAEFIQVL